MRKAYWLPGLLGLGLLGIGILWLGCAGPKPKEEPEVGIEAEKRAAIDTLLGIRDTTVTGEDEEERILRLLGIKTEEEEVKAPKEQPLDLQLQLTQLEEEISRKDEEIRELRAQLEEKEREISRLRAELERVKSQPTTTVAVAGPLSELKIRYQEALNEYKKRNYETAIRLFERLLQGYPNTNLSDNCQYWIGESYYGLGNYDQALVEFEKVFSYANSNKADAAQLKIGLCYLKLGKKEQARKAWERLLQKYPNSEYANLARRYLAKFQ